MSKTQDLLGQVFHSCRLDSMTPTCSREKNFDRVAKTQPKRKSPQSFECTAGFFAWIQSPNYNLMFIVFPFKVITALLSQVPSP
jgi:hypothetical protein